MINQDTNSIVKYIDQNSKLNKLKLPILDNKKKNIISNWVKSVTDHYHYIITTIKNNQKNHQFSLESKLYSELKQEKYPQMVKSFETYFQNKNINQDTLELKNIKNIFNNKNHKVILDQFSNYYNRNYEKINVLIEQLNLDIGQSEFCNNRFCSLEVQLEIENGFKYYYNYDSILDNKYKLKIDIHSHQKISQEELNKIIARAYLIPSYFKKEKSLIIHLFFTNAKKIKKTADNFFGAKEINSGSTGGEDITIWRKEEAMKLILHESVHYYQLDNCWSWMNQLEKMAPEIKCHFQVDNHQEYRVYEAFTETLALIFNTMIVSYHTFSEKVLSKKKSYQKSVSSKTTKKTKKKNRNNKPDIVSQFWKIFEYEQKYSLLNVAKVLLIVNPNIKSLKEFFIINPDKCLEERKNSEKLNQKTSVLSYFIFKSASIVFIGKYLEWQMNKTGKSNNKFYQTQEGIELNDIEDYYNFVHKLVKSSGYVKLVDKCIEDISSEILFKKKSNQLSKTIKTMMRMTVYG